MNEIQEINIQLIDRPEPPVRLSLEDAELDALTDSIRDEGILVPLLLRRKGDRFEIIDGDRRLAVAFRLRLPAVPAVVRDAGDSETVVLRLLANLDRADPDPVSEAVYVSKVIASQVIEAGELAAKLHRGIDWVFDRLTISEMPDYLQDALRLKKIALGAALALTQITDERVRSDWTAAAVRDGMSVRAAEDALREFARFKDMHGANEDGAVLAELPSAPPLVMFECARCGERALLDELKIVRVHKNGCGDEKRG